MCRRKHFSKTGYGGLSLHTITEPALKSNNVIMFGKDSNVLLIKITVFLYILEQLATVYPFHDLLSQWF